MDSRIEKLIDFTKSKFGLNKYYLKRYQLDRSVTIFNETVYTLCMEWFPNHVTNQEDHGSNPEGTASIEIDLKNQKCKSAIFIMGTSYAENGITFANLNTADIIKWVEEETGLRHGEQFHTHKVEVGEVYFKGCIDGVEVSPSGSIEVKFDQEGKLTFFAVHGSFPSREIVNEERYSLSFEKVKHLAKEQLKLIEYPSYEQKKLFPIYAVEEIFVTNNQISPIPFLVDARPYFQIDKTFYWDEPSNQSFDRKEISWNEDISIEQAFSVESSPDSFPISKMEEEKCVKAVKELLRQEYPKSSGIWNLKTLHRDKGYIHATLRPNKRNNRLFQRKLMIVIDSNSLQVVNYMDNKPMIEIFDQFQPPEKVRVTKEQAFEKMKELFELTPYYVYDFEQKQYVLCGKLDCEYGVHASNGGVIALDDL